jgi:hypothetical protein
VFARATDPAGNSELAEYFKDRRVCLLNAWRSLIGLRAVVGAHRATFSGRIKQGLLIVRTSSTWQILRCTNFRSITPRGASTNIKHCYLKNLFASGVTMLTNRVKLLPFLIPFVLILGLGAQTTGTITGTVDSEVGTPVPNATVTVTPVSGAHHSDCSPNRMEHSQFRACHQPPIASISSTQATNGPLYRTSNCPRRAPPTSVLNWSAETPGRPSRYKARRSW